MMYHWDWSELEEYERAAALRLGLGMEDWREHQECMMIDRDDAQCSVCREVKNEYFARRVTRNTCEFRDRAVCDDCAKLLGFD